MALSFEKAFSIGLKSGLYGGEALGFGDPGPALASDLHEALGVGGPKAALASDLHGPHGGHAKS
jgi:hypothetical protein